MTDVSRVAPNFLLLAAAQAVGFLCGLGTTILLARNLGPASYGVLGFGQAFIGFALLLVILGTDAFGAREIARRGAHAGRLVSEILGLRLVLAALVLPTAVVAAYAVGLPARTANVIAVQALGIAAAIVSLDFVCQGIQRMGMIAARQSAAALLVLVGTALLVRAPDDIFVAALLPVVAIALTSLWLFVRLRLVLGGIGVSFDRTAWPPILRVAVPIALGGLSIAVFQHTDVLMLGFHLAEEDVGRYVAMGRLYIVVVTAGNLLAAAFAPVLSQMGADDAAAKERRFRQFLVAVLVFGGPAAAAIGVFPDAALRLLFGAGYVADSDVLSVIMLSALVFLVTVATSTVMVAWDDERYHVKALAVSAAINVALNAVLIPLWGLIGAALATLASVCFLAAAEVRRLSRRDGVAIVTPLLHCFGLLAASFGATRIALELLDPDVRGGAPAVILLGFGGVAFGLFVIAAVTTGLVRPAQLRSALLRRRRS